MEDWGRGWRTGAVGGGGGLWVEDWDFGWRPLGAKLGLSVEDCGGEEVEEKEKELEERKMQQKEMLDRKGGRGRRRIERGEKD